MGNHRAPRRASREDLSDTPYAGRRRLEPPVSANTATLTAVPAIPSPRRASDGATPGTRTGSTPGGAVLNTGSTDGTTAGKRRAVKHAGRRGPLFRVLPSAPVLMGIAALAVSTGGVVTAAHPGLVGSMSEQSVHVVASNALTGISGTSRQSQLAERAAAVSRDSSRAQAAEVAGQEAVEVAEALANERNAALAEVTERADKQAKRIEKNQWSLPVSSYSISASFGESSGLWSNGHTGLDFNTASGAPIYAVSNGVITSTGYDGAYGNKTVLTLEDGTEIWFCHQSSFTVEVGDFVRSGELIGYVGSTGNVTGAHLHLEVRPGGGDPVDPYAALVANHVRP